MYLSQSHHLLRAGRAALRRDTDLLSKTIGNSKPRLQTTPICPCALLKSFSIALSYNRMLDELVQYVTVACQKKQICFEGLSHQSSCSAISSFTKKSAQLLLTVALHVGLHVALPIVVPKMSMQFYEYRCKNQSVENTILRNVIFSNTDVATASHGLERLRCNICFMSSPEISS